MVFSLLRVACRFAACFFNRSSVIFIKIVLKPLFLQVELHFGMFKCKLGFHKNPSLGPSFRLAICDRLDSRMRLVQARAPFCSQNHEKWAQVQNCFTFGCFWRCRFRTPWRPPVRPEDAQITPNHVLNPLETFGRSNFAPQPCHCNLQLALCNL